MHKRDVPDIRDLEARVRRLEGLVAQSVYTPIRAIAERENTYPDTYSGVVRLMERRGIPRRTSTGAKKPSGSRETAYVDLRELRSERMDT